MINRKGTGYSKLCFMSIKRICISIKKNSLTKYILLYGLIVFISATFDWLIFRCNTTSFLISEQLNKYVDRYEFLDPEIDLAAYHRNAKDNLPITIDGFTTLIKPSFEKLEATNDSLFHKQNLLSACKEKLDSLNVIASVMRNDSIERLRDQLISGCQKKIDSLKLFMEGKDSTEMIIAGKYVEMAQLQYEYAIKNVEIQSMILQNFGSFIPDSLSRQIRCYNENYIGLLMDISVLEKDRRIVSSKIRDLTIDFHANRLNAVGFVDFIYYSFCVSTTVSFGDIAPNNGLARAIAIIELLFCIILVGVIVNSSIKRIEEPNGR